MNRRSLLLASLAALPASALVSPARSQRRQPVTRRQGTRRQDTRRQGTRGTKGATRRRQAKGAGPAQRRQGGLTANRVRTRVITRTFTSTAPMDIPAGIPSMAAGPASVYPSTIQVRGFTQGRILKVRPTLIGFGHEIPSEVDVLLVAPDNTGVMIMSDAGGATEVSGVTLTFDQDAPGVPPNVLVSGVYQPANFFGADHFQPPAPQGVSGHALSRFTNRNPNGAWRLFATDDSRNAAGGSLAGWSLQIRARVRVPRRNRRRRQRART